MKVSPKRTLIDVKRIWNEGIQLYLDGTISLEWFILQFDQIMYDEKRRKGKGVNKE